jgi:CDP-paratose 2-epimerase
MGEQIVERAGTGSNGTTTPGRSAFDRLGSVRRDVRPTLITGGAGFIGTNLAHRLLERGDHVIVFDNFSRPQVRANVEWLLSRHGDDGRLGVVMGDARDREAVRRVVGASGRIYHLAAQASVSSSLDDPGRDFDVNAGGTLEVLEAVRARRQPPPLLFASTHHVYGDLGDLPVALQGVRYQPLDQGVAHLGISEERPLELLGPHGCSKGAADQYVIDYGRTYGLATVVLRMSCTYGPHQVGTEDQGWVTHLVRRVLAGEVVTLYGDGCQVIDLLYVDDLIDAMLALEARPPAPGTVFNVGGGPDRQASLLDVLELLRRLHGALPPVSRAPWRRGEPRYYVSDIRRLRRATGWTPRVTLESGLARLYGWLLEEAAAEGQVLLEAAESDPPGPAT